MSLVKRQRILAPVVVAPRAYTGTTRRRSQKGRRRHKKVGRPYMRDGQIWQNKWVPYQVGGTEGVGRYGETWRKATPEQKLNRMANRFYGYGDYSSAWNNYRRFVPRAVGAAAGGWGTRSIAGAAQGWTAGANFSKNILGWGDYGPAQGNQIMGDSQGPISVNQAAGDLTGDIYINHREFVANIDVSTTAFENRTFALNPGLKGTFPFLSQIAQNYTLYELQGLIFEYRPLSGESSSASNSLGKVVMCTNYDPADPPFQGIVQMENYDYSNSGKPSIELLHGVETDPDQRGVKMKYIRTGDVTRDLIFTDIGTFQVATQGIPNPGICGELWVTYRIRLSRAQLSTTLGEASFFDAFYCNASLPKNTWTDDNTALVPVNYEAGHDPLGLAAQAGQISPVYGRSNLGGTLYTDAAGGNIYYEFPEDVIVGETYRVTLAGSSQPTNQFYLISTQNGCVTPATNDRTGICEDDTLYGIDIDAQPLHAAKTTIVRITSVDRFAPPRLLITLGVTTITSTHVTSLVVQSVNSDMYP